MILSKCSRETQTVCQIRFGSVYDELLTLQLCRVMSSIDSSARAGVVSPSEDETPQVGTKTANDTVMEVQTIIAAHAAAQGSAQILAAPVPIVTAPTAMLHQHGTVAAKCPRMDSPMTAVTGAMKNQFMANGHGRIKSQAQINRKREKNCILARQTRLRRKSLFESLQKDLMELQLENSALKEIVSTKLDSKTSIKLLAKCNAIEQLPSSVLEACGKHIDMGRQDCSLVTDSKRNLRKRSLQCGTNGPVTPDVRAKASIEVMDWYSIKRACCKEDVV